jgi:hypothetical protein
MPYPLSAVQQAEVDKKLLVSREALGEAAYAAAWSTGRNEPLAEAVAHTRRALSELKSTAHIA